MRKVDDGHSCPSRTRKNSVFSPVGDFGEPSKKTFVVDEQECPSNVGVLIARMPAK
jgi:hypothetical protein